MKKYRVDGRTKEYREASRRIKERQEKIAQKQVQAKLDMFGVHANPFVEETENKKYLETKPGSIEDAVLNALNPNADKETLTLPKKEEEVEEAYKSPLDSPKAKTAREKLQKTLKDIKKKDPDHPAVQNVKEEEVEEGFGKLKDASKNLAKMRKAAGVKVDKQTTTKLPSGGILRKTTYKKADEANEGPDRRKVDLGGNKRKTDKPKKIPFAQKAEEKKIDELSNKTMDSYAQKASASQADAEKKGDYKKADKRIAGKMRASRRKFSNDTNRILVGLKKESKETENGERDAGSDKYTNYTKEMTPGQGITSDDAKKADVRKKKEQAAQQQQLNVDEDMKYLNTKPGSIEEAILKALMPEAFTTKHEKGDKHNEVPEKKAGETDKDHKDRQAGRVSFKKHRRSLDTVDPEELKGKHADRDDKDIDNDGDVDSSDQYLHRRRQAIASRRKKEDQKESMVDEKHKASKGRLRSPEGKPSDMKWKYKFSPDGRPTPSPRDKADSRERARDSRTIGSLGSNTTGTSGTGPRKNQGTSGKSGANTDRPDWYQSSQKDSKHKTSRGVKTKGVKQTSNRIKPGVKPKGKLPEMFENLVAAKRNQLPRQLKDPKKEKMVGTKTGTKVVDKNDPKYKNAPEHESYEPVDEKTIMGVKVKKLKPGKETKDVQTALHRDNKGGIIRQQARQKFGPKKVGATAEEKE